jgi:uncharacterized damage-inducible protein DinB
MPPGHALAYNRGLYAHAIAMKRSRRMGSRSEALAQQFEAEVAELAKAIEQHPDDKWQATCDGEGWTVAGTAHHVAAQFGLEKEYLSAGAEGRELPAYTWEHINNLNERRAEEYRSCTKADALKLLRESAPAMAAFVRGLSDEQLDRKGKLALAGGAEVSTQQLIEGGVLIDHVRGHTKSIRAAS